MSSFPLLESQELSTAKRTFLEMGRQMNIGAAAKASGITAKMIRHYESVGLFPQAGRTEAGYRQYSEREVNTLRFIRHSRDLGFSIEQIRALLDLWLNQKRPSRQVKALAQHHLDEVDSKLEALQAIQGTLEHLLRHCHGDDRPDCPIIDSLSREEGPVPAKSPAQRGRTAGLKSGGEGR